MLPCLSWLGLAGASAFECQQLIKYNPCIIIVGMAWEIQYTDQFEAWFDGLDRRQQNAIIAAVDYLEARGPGLGRPMVDTLRGSRHANMNELRPRGGHLRVLFSFPPRRTAILLRGGDKSGRWTEWYETAVPEADRLYDEHLATLRKERLLP
jgi:hypothetical protein